MITDRLTTAENIQYHNGLSVLPNLKCKTNYLDTIEALIDKSIDTHPRTLAVRFDLHFPKENYFEDGFSEYDANEEIKKFIPSLKSKIRAEQSRKEREGKRVHKTQLNYMWVLEYGDKGRRHYHVVIFVNYDAYRQIKFENENTWGLADLIVDAWQSVLRVNAFEMKALVHFPRKKSYYPLNVNKPSYYDDYNRLFKRLSYLAKSETKNINSDVRSMGSSARKKVRR